MKKPKFKVDQRVKLLPFAETNQPEQEGTVETYEGHGLYIVVVDAKYRDKLDRDGLREAMENQLEAL